MQGISEKSQKPVKLIIIDDFSIKFCCSMWQKSHISLPTASQVWNKTIFLKIHLTVNTDDILWYHTRAAGTSVYEKQSGIVPHIVPHKGRGSPAHAGCIPRINCKPVTEVSSNKNPQTPDAVLGCNATEHQVLLQFPPASATLNQTTVLLRSAAVCILTRLLDDFMSQDGRCEEVKGCCGFLCHSALSDTGPGKTRGSLWRSGGSKVTTWHSSGVDLGREWVSGEVANSEAFWHELQWLSGAFSSPSPEPTHPQPPTHTVFSNCVVHFSFCLRSTVHSVFTVAKSSLSTALFSSRLHSGAKVRLDVTQRISWLLMRSHQQLEDDEVTAEMHTGNMLRPVH